MTIPTRTLPSPPRPPRHQVALSALLPALVFVLIWATICLAAAQRELGVDARLLIESADPFFERVGGELAAALARPQATCNALQTRGGALAVRSEVLLNLVPAGTGLAALCPAAVMAKPAVNAPATRGAAGKSPSDALAAATGVLTVRGWPGSTDALLAETILPDGRGLGAQVDAGSLVEYARGRASESRHAIWLSWQQGSVQMLAGSLESIYPSTLGLRVVLPSARHHYAVGMAIGSGGLWQRYAGHLPLVAAGSLGIALAGVVLVHRRWQRRHAPSAQLRAAITRGEFEGHLQPIVELASGDCVGAEMLMRWRHPQHGLLAPAHFLQDAKASGLLWAMTEACFRDIALRLDRCDTLPDGFMLCVNFGAAELSCDGDSDRFAALARPGGRRWNTVIELPERDAREPAMAARLSALQNMGFLIGLDDFGTAHGGTRWLERLSVDLVKIDHSIVATIGTDSVTRPVLDAIITMARETGVKLIAEGVEHANQLLHLRRQCVSFAQGYHFSAPLPAAEFIERWLAVVESDDDPSITRHTSTQPAAI